MGTQWSFEIKKRNSKVFLYFCFKHVFSRWTGTINILNIDTVKFRYFLGYYLEADTLKSPTLIISKWETHLTCRSVMPAIEASKTRVCRANVYDIFGFHGKYILKKKLFF